MEKFEPTLDPRCGLYSGYKAHRAKNEHLCQPCRQAMRDYRKKIYDKDTNAKYAKKYKAKFVQEKEAKRAEKNALKAQKAAEAKAAKEARIKDRKARGTKRNREEAARKLAFQEKLKATEARRQKEHAEIEARKLEQNERREAKQAAKEQVRLSLDTARAQKKLEVEQALQVKRAEKQAIATKLSNQHGTTVGDYDRCRKNNKTACDLCRAAASKYVREKYHSDPKYKEAEKRWKKTNRNKLGFKSRDRAKKYGVPSQYYTRKHLFDRDGYDCYLCNIPVDLTAPYIQGQPGWEAYPHIDHVTPLAKGGHDTLDNVKIAHAGCNIRKGVSLIK